MWSAFPDNALLSVAGRLDAPAFAEFVGEFLAEDARKATLYAAAFCLPLGFLLALIGVAAKYLYPDMNSLYALPVFLEKMPPLATAFVTTSLVASIFVSVCTVALAIASLVVRDFYVPYWKPSPER